MKKIHQILIWLVYISVIIIPIIIWFNLSKEAFQYPWSQTTALGLFFPLAGLIALSFLWIEFTLGVWRNTLYKIFNASAVLKFHIAGGIFTFLFALVHPFFLFLLTKLLGNSYFELITTLPSPVKYYWLIGYSSLFLLTLAALAGILRKNKFMEKYWRYIHYLNYLVLPLVLVHAWNLGSHVQGTAYSQMWYFFTASYIFSLVFTLTAKFGTKVQRDNLATNSMSTMENKI